MTIQFQGHVKKTKPCGKDVEITIHGEMAICREPIVLIIPKEKASAYIAGKSVQITLYTFD